MSLRKLKEKFSSKGHIQGGDSAQTVAWNTLQTVLTIAKEAIDDVPAPGVKAALGALLAVIDTIQTTRGNLEDIKTLTEHLQHIKNDIVDPLKEAAANNVAYMSDALKQLTDKLEIDLNSIKGTARHRSSRSTFQRFVSSSSDVSVIQQMNRSLDVALQAFQTGTIVSVATRTEEIHQVVISTQMDVVETKEEVIMTKEVVLRTEAHALSKAELDIIKTLPRSEEARHDSWVRREAGATCCLEGTRESTLARIDDWIDSNDPNQPFIFWVWGLAGTGKSTIAQTVAERQATRGRLGASFFFSRDRASQKNGSLLFPSLAFQLSLFNPNIRNQVAGALSRDPDVAHALVQHQFEELIAGPLAAAGVEPIVIVIDALDECDPDTQIGAVLQVLANSWMRHYHSGVKVLITSRPEDRIHSSFSSSGLDSISHPYILHDIGQSSVKEDILVYLQYHLNKIAARCDVEIPWPTLDILEILLRRINTFFIWAATAVKFIGDEAWNDPEYQLRVLLDDKGEHVLDHIQAIDNLYMTVLRRAIPSDNRGLSDRFRTVVGTIVLVRDPMSANMLDAFLSLSRGTVHRTLKQLRSLLVVPDDPDSSIRVFHQSFPEFLCSPERCDLPRFFIDAPASHAHIASLCLKQLSALRRDICDIGNAALLNNEVPDLETRLARLVPDVLRYSCIHFTSHLVESTSCNESFTTTLTSFCESRILAWIETLSYLGRLEVAGPALRTLRDWYESSPTPDSRIKEILYDAERLVTQFFHAIRLGASYIYTAALPWAPKSALLDAYKKEVPAFYVIMGQEDQWDLSLCIMEGCDVPSECAMSLTEDGMLAAAITKDYDGNDVVGLWATETGARMAPLSTLHRVVIRSVALSAEGTLAAACSDDWTIHIWDLEHKTCRVVTTPELTSVAEPKEPFPDAFGRVVFPGPGWVSLAQHPAVNRLFSTGPEGQLYCWDSTGGQLMSSRQSHTAPITCVGVKGEQWIATGSADSTVCVWPQNSLDSLPQTISKASHDRSVGETSAWIPSKSWTRPSIPFLRTAAIIRPKRSSPLILLHPSPLTSVRFKSDGEQIVSTCASDSVVRVWSSDEGVLLYAITMPESTERVIFTPNDWLLIWSAIGSTRLHVVDTETFSPLATFANHSHHITAISLTKGGSEAVSASKDGTMRAWDVGQYNGMVRRRLVREQRSGTDNTRLPPPSLSSSGNRLAFALSLDELRICDLPSGNIVTDIKAPERAALMALSPDGEHLVTWPTRGERGSLFVHDTAGLAGPMTTTLPRSPSPAAQIVYSPDGHLFAILRQQDPHRPVDKPDSNVCVFETQSLRRIATVTLVPPSYAHVAFTSDSRLICHLDDTLYIWDLPAARVGPSYGKPVDYSTRDASVKSRFEKVIKKGDHGGPQVVISPFLSLFIQGFNTVMFDSDRMVELNRRLAGVDGDHRFMLIRDAWIWEVDGEMERKLCWLPYKLRGNLRKMEWAGGYLVLTPDRGRIVVLDIDILRRQAIFLR